MIRLINENESTFSPDITKYNCKNPKKLNVYIVCDYMDWNLPTFADKGTKGYLCKWGGRTQVSRYGADAVQKDLDKIYDGTGIRCSIAKSGKIIIPFYEGEAPAKSSLPVKLTSEQNKQMKRIWNEETDDMDDFVRFCLQDGYTPEQITSFYWKNRKNFGKSEKGFVPEEFDYDPDETIQDFLNYVLKFIRGV